MSQQVPPVRRPRHLMDPNDPRPPQRSGRGMSLDTVQKWVMSVLAVTTIYHLGSVSALAAVLTDENRLDARIGLNVIASAIGVVAVATGFLIHGRHPVTPWLLVGLLPGLVGAYFTFR